MYLPLVYGLSLGFEERYGIVDDDGNFVEISAGAATFRERKNFLPLAGELLLEIPCTAELLDTGGKAVGEIEVGVVEERLVCVAVRAYPGHELTGHIFRQIPISKLVREAARSRIAHLRDGFAVRFLNQEQDPDIPRRRTLNDEFLAAVAAEYRKALFLGIPPSLSVAQRFGPTTHENARRWVAAARREGFLGESPGQRRKGEVQSS